MASFPRKNSYQPIDYIKIIGAAIISAVVLYYCLPVAISETNTAGSKISAGLVGTVVGFWLK